MTPPSVARAQCDFPSTLATRASYEGLFGPYHVQTLALTTVLAVSLSDAGHRADARRLLERAAGDLTKHHGRHHPARIRALEALSDLLGQERDWKTALPRQRELLDCRTHLLGADHPATSGAERDIVDEAGTGPDTFERQPNKKEHIMASVLSSPTENKVAVSATKLLINNRWVNSQSGKTFPTINQPPAKRSARWRKPMPPMWTRL